MPYYLHDAGIKSEPIEHARVACFDKHAALAERRSGEAVTFQPTRSEIDAWQNREYQRLYGGDGAGVKYQPLPFSTPWEHYAHRSPSDPAKISYTPDHTYGHEDRRLVTTPVRYLEKYAELISYSRDQFAELAAKMRAGTMTVQLATTADDIARVYCAPNGPTSCMDGREFALDNTPVRAYAGGDLACAYMGTLGTRPELDRIFSRAIVWPERKEFVRAYGDIDAMIAALTADGYKQISSWRGAKIRAIDAGNNQWIVPYIDGGAQRLEHDGGEYLIIGQGTICGSNTSGVADRADAVCCRQCGDRISRSDADDNGGLCLSCYDDSFTCAHCNDESFGDAREVHDELWCARCYRDQRADCDHCGYRFNTAESESTEYCDDCYEEITTCEGCDTEGHSDDLDLREHGDDGRSLCIDCRRHASRPRRQRQRRPAVVVHYATPQAIDALMAWVTR